MQPISTSAISLRYPDLLFPEAFTPRPLQPVLQEKETANERAPFYKSQIIKDKYFRLLETKDLLTVTRKSVRIRQKELLNQLHHIHFSDGHLLLHVRNQDDRIDYLLTSRLDACASVSIDCVCLSEAVALEKMDLLNIVIDDGRRLTFFPVHGRKTGPRSFTFEPPRESYIGGERSVRRIPCDGVEVELDQNGFSANGRLLNFSAAALCVEAVRISDSSGKGIAPDEIVDVLLRRGAQKIFRGPCRIRRMTESNRSSIQWVLDTSGKEFNLFARKQGRAPRLCMTPAPRLHFDHPLFARTCQREIGNIGYSGFSVEETSADSVLMPGMIIRGVEIELNSGMKIPCDVEVVYRNRLNGGRFRCGMAILDMSFPDYRRLSHLIAHSSNRHASFDPSLDTGELWEFFFSTGFIYPQKYLSLQDSRDAFKNTYDRLCSNSQEIESHFTCQENGKIYGHASIFRAYPRTWMVHHLAARPLNGKRLGLAVLKNILQFFDGLYRYPKVGMDHMMFYFRPDNHFPDMFFGSFAREIADPQICTLDLFSYMTYRQEGSGPMPEGWKLDAFDPARLDELKGFYGKSSGGMLLDVLLPGAGGADREFLSALYKSQGLERRWDFRMLVHQNRLQAFFVVNHSSPGLNLSEFLNSIKIIITDPEGLSGTVLRAALTELSREFTAANVPLLIYPASYPASQGWADDKKYLLWILNTQYAKEYLAFMEKRTRLKIGLIARHFLKKIFSYDRSRPLQQPHNQNIHGVHGGPLPGFGRESYSGLRGNYCLPAQ